MYTDLGGDGTQKVAPTFRGGRGLKHGRGCISFGKERVAPTFRGGRGLKHQPWDPKDTPDFVAPTFRGGRGLKRPLEGTCAGKKS